MDSPNVAGKIPLWLAVLININVIVGGAFFIAAPKLAALSGWASPIMWLLVCAMFIPLALVFATFAKKFPVAGGFYVYPREAFGRLCGFLTGWVYFFATAFVVSILIDDFAVKVVGYGTLQTGFYRFALSMAISVACVMFSAGGVKVLKGMHLTISWLKVIPLILLAVACVVFGKFENLTNASMTSDWFSDSLPIVVFAYLGIETCCAIAHELEDGSKNVSKATYLSLMVTGLIYFFAQFALVFSMGQAADSPDSFSVLAANIFKSNPVISWLVAIIVKFCISTSYLGGAYGTFCSNNWNLFAMAQDLKGPSRIFLTRLNKVGEPIVCILTQGIIFIGALCIARSQSWLVQVNVAGTILSFIIIVLAYIAFFGLKKVFFSGIFALASCAVFTFFSIRELVQGGLFNTMPLFLSILLAAIFYFYDRDQIK